jgi:hypothetical protein
MSWSASKRPCQGRSARATQPRPPHRRSSPTRGRDGPAAVMCEMRVVFTSHGFRAARRQIGRLRAFARLGEGCGGRIDPAAPRERAPNGFATSCRSCVRFVSECPAGNLPMFAQITVRLCGILRDPANASIQESAGERVPKALSLWISEPWWRRGRDSNPRTGFPITPLAGARLRPLGHLSASRLTGLQAARQVISAPSRGEAAAAATGVATRAFRAASPLARQADAPRRPSSEASATPFSAKKKRTAARWRPPGRGVAGALDAARILSAGPARLGQKGSVAPCIRRRP